MCSGYRFSPSYKTTRDPGPLTAPGRHPLGGQRACGGRGLLMREFRFEQDLVRALLRDQHPDLADLELRDVNGGWDNQQWRLGDELAVGLPRTERAPALLHTEQSWLPVLANRLPLTDCGS